MTEAEQRHQQLAYRILQKPLAFGNFVMADTFSKPSPDFHYLMEDTYLDDGNELVVIIAPRAHAKTSIWANCFAIHHLAKMLTYRKLGLVPAHKRAFVLLISRTEGHSNRLLSTNKLVLSFSQNFAAFWGRHDKDNTRIWTNNMIVLASGDAMMTRGTGQQVVGMKIGNQRPTLIILDDPEDSENTKTEERLEANLKWLLQSVMPMRDPDMGRIVVIGTPQHQRCIVEKLRESSEWKSHFYSAEVDASKKIALWEEQWPWDKLQKERRRLESVGRLSSYFREYLCTIIADEEQIFKQEYLQFYDGTLETHEFGDNILIVTHRHGKRLEVPERIPVNVFVGVDPAVSLRADADYTVILPVAEDSNKNFYILPFIRRRMPPSETIAQIKRICQNVETRKVSIETTAAQDTFRDILHKMDDHHIPGLATKHHPREKKEKRYLEVLEPYFFRKKVWLTPHMQSFVDEYLMFGPTAKHDDQLDALYWAMKGAYPPSHSDQKSPQRGDTVVSRIAGDNWETA